MSAEIKISNQQILAAALDIVRNDGIDSLNARSVCKKIGCTARPIFRAFSSMDGLKHALLVPVKEIYIQYITKPIESKYAFLNLGMNYIQFAVEEKNLFMFLFMTNQIDIQTPTELISDGWSDVIEEMSVKLNLSQDNAKTLLLELSILAHGMAVLITTNSIRYQQSEIERLFLIAFEGILTELKSKYQKES